MVIKLMQATMTKAFSIFTSNKKRLHALVIIELRCILHYFTYYKAILIFISSQFRTTRLTYHECVFVRQNSNDNLLSFHRWFHRQRSSDGIGVRVERIYTHCTAESSIKRLAPLIHIPI